MEFAICVVIGYALMAVLALIFFFVFCCLIMVSHQACTIQFSRLLACFIISFCARAKVEVVRWKDYMKIFNYFYWPGFGLFDCFALVVCFELLNYYFLSQVFLLRITAFLLHFSYLIK